MTLTAGEDAQVDYTLDVIALEAYAVDFARVGDRRRAMAYRRRAARAFWAGLAERFNPQPDMALPCGICHEPRVCDQELHLRLGKLPPCVPVREFGR